ncbi:MAG: carbohydrate kinase family protein [Verrucomicrobia bacterium]|nr:carbohydrate kinase family protein [Verrucomicrobiota bacterium]
MPKTPRQGILAAGNFIVDYVKVIDGYPAQDMLASILSESRSNGGGPYNVLKDLAAMKVEFPLAACGLVGDDTNGQWIKRDCQNHRIDVGMLHLSKDHPTSYTDAMTVQSTGRRTFFHCRGANAHFDLKHCSFSKTNARILHLGYLMLLDRMDTFENGQTIAAKLLFNARSAGLETSVDMCSASHPQFREIALSALPLTDHLVVNEIETGLTLGEVIDPKNAGWLLRSAEQLLSLGVKKTVTIHTEYGAVCATAEGLRLKQASLKLPAGYSKGATGAGDAFAAGMLYGLHEGLEMQERLKLAVCCAAACLADPTPSKGLRPVKDCLALAEQFGFGEF